MYEYKLLENKPSNAGCVLSLGAAFSFIGMCASFVFGIKTGYIECYILLIVFFIIFAVIVSNPQFFGIYNSYNKALYDEENSLIALKNEENNFSYMIPVYKISKIKLKEFKNYDMIRIKQIFKASYKTIFFKQGEGRNFYDLIINSKEFSPKTNLLINFFIAAIFIMCAYLVYERFF